jgi:hypothetical protein
MPRHSAVRLLPFPLFHLLTCCLLSLAVSCFAASAPTLDALYPAGAQRGSSNVITASGKFDPWPPKVWLSGKGVDFTAETNKSKFAVAIDPDANPGPRLVRLFNDEGASECRIFVVGDAREISETETNNHFARPQQIDSLPVTINGRLEKGGDVDSFAVQLRRGDTLDARLDSYVLMSKLDGVLRLVTTNGYQLAWNHDFASLDPRLIWSATNDQTIIVQVYGFPHPATASVNLYGGESAFYRLHLRADASHVAQDGILLYRRMASGNPPPPSDALVTTNGIIASAEEARITFSATKDQPLALKVAAATFGSPLDAWLKVEDANGKELARNDDAEGTRDPSLEWKAPTDGTYTATIGSLTHRGGPDYRYYLTIEPLRPDFEANLSANSLTVTADSTNSIKFKLKRLSGHTNELSATLLGLPEGGTSISTNLDAKVNGEISLPIIIATTSPTFSGPIQLKLTDLTTTTDRVITFPLLSRTEDNGVPGGYSTLLVDDLDHLWLTVKPKPVEPPKETAKK